MGIHETAAVLPPDNPLRRVLDFCVSDLHLSLFEAAIVLRQAYYVAAGLETMDREVGYCETDEANRKARANRLAATVSAPPAPV